MRQIILNKMNLILRYLVIRNKPHTFFQTSEDCILSSKRTLTKIQIKPEKEKHYYHVTKRIE